MWVPVGWVALSDAGEELKGNVSYEDPWDWASDLWEAVAAMSEVRALMPDHNTIKNTDKAITLDPLHAKWPRGTFGICENGHIDVCDGNVISGTAKGLPIILPESEWKKFLKALVREPSSQGGRPPHPAKVWYEGRDCSRMGQSMKELQREMETKCGKPPSEATIRAWEKEFKEKTDRN
jgi:hypothetical protein